MDGWQLAGGKTFDFSNPPDFDDPEDFVDEICDYDLVGDLYAQAPREAQGIENVVIVDNIPKTAKLQKLQDKLSGIWKSKAGVPLNQEYPTEMVDGQPTTKGYCFLEFEDEETALKAQENINNHRFDKKHVFLANLFTDIEKFADTSDEWIEPNRKVYEDMGNLYSHMTEPNAFDQFVVTYEDGKMTEVFLNKRPEGE